MDKEFKLYLIQPIIRWNSNACDNFLHTFSWSWILFIFFLPVMILRHSIYMGVLLWQTCIMLYLGSIRVLFYKKVFRKAMFYEIAFWKTLQKSQENTKMTFSKSSRPEAENYQLFLQKAPPQLFHRVLFTSLNFKICST